MNIMMVLDGTEIRTTSKYKTYCNLCNRLINQGEEVYTWQGRHFFIHLDCNSPEVKERMTNTFFKKNVKKRSVKTGASRNRKSNGHRSNWY